MYILRIDCFFQQILDCIVQIIYFGSSISSRAWFGMQFMASNTACLNGSFFTISFSWRTFLKILPPDKAPLNNVNKGLDKTWLLGFQFSTL